MTHINETVYLPLFREVRFTPLAALGRLLIYVRECPEQDEADRVCLVTHGVYLITAYLVTDEWTLARARLLLDHSDLLMAKAHASTVKT